MARCVWWNPVFRLLPLFLRIRPISNLKALQHLESIGGTILANSPLDLPWQQIKTPATGSALLDPLVSLGAYYRVIEAVTRRRGFNPDKPLNLNKVTETV